MPTLEELTAMVEQAGGDPKKLTDAVKQALSELTGAQTQLHSVNKEAAERRKRLEALEADEAKRKEAEMTEAQKVAAQLKAAEEKALQAEQEKMSALAKAQETMTRSMVLVKASSAGFNDPADAWQFLDRSKVKINDAGEVEGIEKALEELAKAKPYLLKEPDQKQRPNGTPPGKAPASGNKKPIEVPVIHRSY